MASNEITIHEKKKQAISNFKRKNTAQSLITKTPFTTLNKILHLEYKKNIGSKSLNQNPQIQPTEPDEVDFF